MDLLESALDAPRANPFGVEQFPTLAEKSARLLYGVTKNHSWSNGNRRMGLLLTLVFLGATTCGGMLPRTKSDPTLFG
jgi:death-on-curing protein